MAKKEVINNDAMTLRVDDGPVETVLDVAEQAIDATEAALDILENQVDNVVTITKNNPLVMVGALLVGVGIGGFIAYKIAVKRTALKYEDIMAEEIDAAKTFYKRLAKEGEFETPQGAVEALVPGEVVSAISSYQGKDQATRYDKVEVAAIEETVVVEKVEITNNVFTENRTDPRDWDYNHEISVRDTTKPYIISFDEFHENEEGNEQVTVSYYAGDKTLADEKDQPIDNEDNVVGEDNLLRFGHGSHDSKVVYIRNERLGMDFEVIRSGGEYAKEVMGLTPEPEIRHSRDRRPPRRFRGTDE